MTTSPDSSNNEKTYPIDTESATEMARLMEQDRLATLVMGGVFSEYNNDLSNLHDILDIACGPGGWVLEVAGEFPDTKVTGIDLSARMVQYASAHAKARGIPNAHFRAMNAVEPLDFSDNSFDLVNARTIVGFMAPARWLSFLQECVRITRPGGIIRMTEAEWGFTNKPALEKLYLMVSQALQRAGQSFSPNGYHLGIIPVIHRLMQQAGCTTIQQKAYVGNYSIGTETYEGTRQDLMILFSTIQPFLIKTRVTTPEEFDALYQQAVAEMHMDDYCSVSFIVTTWGRKSLQDSTDNTPQ